MDWLRISESATMLFAGGLDAMWCNFETGAGEHQPAIISCQFKHGRLRIVMPDRS